MSYEKLRLYIVLCSMEHSPLFLSRFLYYFKIHINELYLTYRANLLPN
jgi:hypothetical protein